MGLRESSAYPIPRIIEQLRRLEVPVLHRAVIEKLFGLKRRQAIQLLHRFGGYQAGRTFLLDRQELVEQLEAIRDGETFRYEQRRRRRLVAELESVRKYLQAAAVKIPLRPQARYQIATLPPDVDLQPGRLHVRGYDIIESVRLSTKGGKPKPALPTNGRWPLDPTKRWKLRRYYY